MEDVLNALLLKPETRDEFIVAAQRCLVLQVHASHNGIDTLFVHFCKRQATMLQEQVACMLSVMEVVGIVDNALDVAFVVAHLHEGFKNIFAHNSLFLIFYLARSAQVFITNPTAQTFLLVTILFLQLNQSLRVTRRFYLKPTLLPHADDVVVLSLELFEEVEGPVAKLFAAVMTSVCKEQRDAGVDKEQIDGERRQVFGIVAAL